MPLIGSGELRNKITECVQSIIVLKNADIDKIQSALSQLKLPQETDAKILDEFFEVCKYVCSRFSEGGEKYKSQFSSEDFLREIAVVYQDQDFKEKMYAFFEKYVTGETEDSEEAIEFDYGLIDRVIRDVKEAKAEELSVSTPVPATPVPVVTPGPGETKPIVAGGQQGTVDETGAVTLDDGGKGQLNPAGTTVTLENGTTVPATPVPVVTPGPGETKPIVAGGQQGTVDETGAVTLDDGGKGQLNPAGTTVTLENGTTVPVTPLPVAMPELGGGSTVVMKDDPLKPYEDQLNPIIEAVDALLNKDDPATVLPIDKILEAATQLSAAAEIMGRINGLSPLGGMQERINAIKDKFRGAILRIDDAAVDFVESEKNSANIEEEYVVNISDKIIRVVDILEKSAKAVNSSDELESGTQAITRSAKAMPALLGIIEGKLTEELSLKKGIQTDAQKRMLKAGKKYREIAKLVVGAKLALPANPKKKSSSAISDAKSELTQIEPNEHNKTILFMFKEIKLAKDVATDAQKRMVESSGQLKSISVFALKNGVKIS